MVEKNINEIEKDEKLLKGTDLNKDDSDEIIQIYNKVEKGIFIYGQEIDRINNGFAIDRDLFALNLAKARYLQGQANGNGIYPSTIEFKGTDIVSLNFSKDYPELQKEFDAAIAIEDESVRAEALSKVDAKLAERIILENGHYVEHRNEEEADKMIEELSKVSKYEDKLIKIEKDGVYYVGLVGKKQVNRDQFANNLSKNRYENGGMPSGKVDFYGEDSLDVDSEKYEDLFQEYEIALNIIEESERARLLSEIDTKLAERMILDNYGVVEFTSKQKADRMLESLKEVSGYENIRLFEDGDKIYITK